MPATARPAGEDAAQQLARQRRKRTRGLQALQVSAEFVESERLVHQGIADQRPVHPFEQSLGLDPAHPEGLASKRQWESAQQDFRRALRQFALLHGQPQASEAADAAAGEADAWATREPDSDSTGHEPATDDA